MSTRRALSRQRGIKAGFFIRTSPKTLISAEFFDKYGFFGTLEYHQWTIIFIDFGDIFGLEINDIWVENQWSALIFHFCRCHWRKSFEP